MIKDEIIKILKDMGVKSEIELSKPPKSEMGDFAFGCFDIAKLKKQNPVKVAKELVDNILKQVQNDSERDPSVPQDDKGVIQDLDTTSTDVSGYGASSGIIKEVKAFGPYVNFYVNPQYLAKQVLEGMDEKKKSKEKIVVEYACPNTHKAFHIGHLRNVITGESVIRILEYVGYDVKRVNYQGDVGMHIAKALFGINQDLEEYEKTKSLSLKEKANYLGKAYARGAELFEKNEENKQKVVEINDLIYAQDKTIKEIYQETRQWSLDYFEDIYKKVGCSFNRYYFESEVYEKGIKIVNKFLKKKVFEVGDGGAIIFPGSKYGLHNRVFITSKGFPTYEAKDTALAKLQYKDFKPEKIIHIVGKEQSEYFKVLFKSLEFTYPKLNGKEYHLAYGWVSLKSGKMSSRTGQVVLATEIIKAVEEEVSKNTEDKELVSKIGMSAIKYAFLKPGVRNDIKFDLKESVSTVGDSGPYLLYILARIKSIIKKAGDIKTDYKISKTIKKEEKALLLKLSEFNEVVKKSAIDYDPSKIAQYLFDLAKLFNVFYENCPVLKVEEESVKNFRLNLIAKIEKTVEKGLYLLGIESVEKM